MMAVMLACCGWTAASRAADPVHGAVSSAPRLTPVTTPGAVDVATPASTPAAPVKKAKRPIAEERLEALFDTESI
ncbi:hypothetical protein [Gluconacetobacter entanii]|uniref:hypothetical protein n=1 Tax=Gluconacetobacter entanii TaxID=108528 RepID=UPI0026B35F16